MTDRTPRLAIFGAGAFGTALALVAARAGREILLWGRDGAAMAEMASRRENTRHLPGVRLPDAITPVADAETGAGADTLIIAIPTQNLREAMTDLAPLIRPGTALVAAAKGIEQHTGAFVTDILRSTVPEAAPAILSGPSFATDIARGLPTAVTLAAADAGRASDLATAIAGPGFRIYHSDDVRGVEIGGAAKNVLAIAAGIVSGANLGESARAALVARGFAELRRLAAGVGARPDTLMGLSGLGDLVLTASSAQSRNFTFGVALGRGQSVAEAGAGKLAEGAFTAPALVAMARSKGVEMPIATAVAMVVAGRLSVREAIAGLIERPQKSE
ncbi:MAG: NAD(P)-dependent glycerol-3-phosphate dehydrogenase [Proteobacteria bacterium]|nr:NAD(P)-dependent glycerol-3-phosphate dehydrogenase [Pseudomonadota bacterium]